MKQKLPVAVKTVREVMTSPVLHVEENLPLRAALTIMREKRISSLFVGEKSPGIITERDLVRVMNEKRDLDAMCCHDLMHNPLVTIEGKENHLEAYNRMVERGIRHLAVADDSGNIIGVMTEGDILRELEADYFSQFRNVASVMTERLCLCSPEVTVAAAVRRMDIENQSAVIVIDDQARPAGILTERDIVRFAEENRDLDAITLASVMSSPVRSICKEHALIEVTQLMEEAKIRRMVVVDEAGRAVGLLSRHEIVQGLESRYVGFLKGVIERQGSKKNFLDNILRSATDTAVIATDLDFCIEYCSQAAQALFGYDPITVIGRDLTQLMDGFDQAVSSPLASGEHHFENRYGQRVIDCRVSPLNDEANTRQGYLLLARDISERKTLDEQTRLTASVFEHSREMIVITDAEQNILVVNKAFSEITGYAADEVIGKNPGVLKSGRHDRDFYLRMWKAIVSEGYWQGEIWDRRKNGEIFPTLQIISAVKDAEGRLTHYIGMAADITEHKKAEERIRLLAFYDPLTGLPNKELLRSQADRTLAEARRERLEVGMLFLDLDHFKTINDSLGHLLGDSLLKAVAERLGQTLREIDIVGRIGGDEFLMMFSPLDASGAARVAQKLIAAIAQPFEIEGHSLNITPSIGISIFPRDGDDFDELFKNADAAMYKAKESGRNGYNFFTPEMNAMAFERLMLESNLRRALKQNEFILYYQPQIEIRSGKITGFEALIRWNHPELGRVAPAKFIPIAEESNLIVQIGEWVLREACRQNKAWQDAGLPGVVVAVNISGRQFAQEELAGLISSVLAETGLDQGFLEVEITESMLVQDLDKTLRTLQELKRNGVKIAIDDFGTGYSSLAYLKRFPIDKLKIDQSFVRDLENDADDRAISAAVVNLGRSLGFTVIAEGVESEEQRRLLEKMGCDEAQGFLISEPLPGAAVADFLLRRQN